jgi:hypothetical protein
MAVTQNVIKTALIEMSNELKEMKDADESAELWAEMLSKIIMDSIKSASVIGVSTVVTTVGSASTQTGTGVQSGTGSLQ